MSNISHYTPLPSLLKTIVDNRGKTVPITEMGFPLIATNCIKHSSLYPTQEKVRFVSNDVKETWFRAHPESNDIIFVNKGTPGRVCLVPNPVSFCIAQDMMAFRCDSDLIDYRYLFAVMRSSFIQKTIENFHVGLVIPHFKKGDLGNILIPRKEKKSQEGAIGNLYVTLSQKIEINNKIKSELEALAKLIYHYWFVQFDFPDAKGRPYKSSGGKMVYNEELKRDIPAGWKVKELSEITAIKAGGDKPQTLSENVTETCTVPVYSNGVTNYGLYGYTDSAKITSPSISISARGTIGVTFLRMKPFVPIIRLIVVTPNNQNYLKYLDECLSVIGFEDSGSVQKQLTAPQVSRLKIICPTEELLE
ncbi:MAG: restriction endonuclease subunit S, partial [Colwellia sp.]